MSSCEFIVSSKLGILTTSYQCYYHPAPLTRPKNPIDGVGPPSSIRQNKPKAHVRPSRAEETIAARTLTDIRKRATPSAGTGARESNDSNYLGTTSYLSVFKETPSWTPRASWNCSLQAEFEHWRRNHAYASARLVRLLCAVGFYRKEIKWYYARGRFTKIPGPLVLDPLRLVQEHIEKNAWNQERNWERIYDQITAATSHLLRLTSDSSPEEFYSLFTGENLRWEFVGLIFSLAGNSVRCRYDETHILDLGNGEEMDAYTFCKEMVLASNACIEICRQYEHVNDLVIWMYKSHLYLGSEVLGETSVFSFLIYCSSGCDRFQRADVYRRESVQHVRRIGIRNLRHGAAPRASFYQRSILSLGNTETTSSGNTQVWQDCCYTVRTTASATLTLLRCCSSIGLIRWSALLGRAVARSRPQWPW